MTDRTDLGTGELYPFCPCMPGGGQPPRRRPLVYYARDGRPDRIVVKVERSAKEGRAVRAQTVDGLEWYYRYKPDLITRPLYAAGRRLCETFEAAKLMSGDKAMDYAKVRVDGSVCALSDKALELIDGYMAALHYVGGPEMDMLLLHVVCEDKPMAEFERRHGWRANSGHIVLRQALYRLALHYGYLDEPRRLWAA